MFPLPQVAEPLLMSLSIAFTEPTFKRVIVLLVGAVLAKARRDANGGRQRPGHLSMTA